jgi:hypothetical protein
VLLSVLCFFLICEIASLSVLAADPFLSWPHTPLGFSFSFPSHTACQKPSFEKDKTRHHTRCLVCPLCLPPCSLCAQIQRQMLNQHEPCTIQVQEEHWKGELYLAHDKGENIVCVA